MAHIDSALFDMVNDPLETINVLEEYPEVSSELIRLAKAHASRFYAEPSR